MKMIWVNLLKVIKQNKTERKSKLQNELMIIKSNINITQTSSYWI